MGGGPALPKAPPLPVAEEGAALAAAHPLPLYPQARTLRVAPMDIRASLSDGCHPWCGGDSRANGPVLWGSPVNPLCRQPAAVAKSRAARVAPAAHGGRRQA